MCSRPLASERSVFGSGCRWRVGELGGRGAPGVDDDVPGAALAALLEEPHGGRHRVGRVAADEHEHVGLRDVVERERQAAVHAERPGRRRRPPTTCRSGRCSRCCGCAARRGRTCRTGRPSRWSARRRRTRRRRRGRARPACAVIAAAIRSSASSQLAGRNGSSRESRTSGVVSRSGWSSSSVAVAPLMHSPPRLTGKSSRPVSSSGAVRARSERDPALQGAVRAVRVGRRGHRVQRWRPPLHRGCALVTERSFRRAGRCAGFAARWPCSKLTLGSRR